MQLVMPIALALVVAISFGGVEGFRRPFRPMGHPPFPFPKCQSFMDAVEQRKRENEMKGVGGPWTCRERGLSPADCRFEDMLKARNEISVEPSEECWNQVDRFFEGSNSTGEAHVSSTTTDGSFDVTMFSR